MKKFEMTPGGVWVKRCCASCAFKQLTRTTLRRCKLKDQLVRSSDVCDEWLMSGMMKKLKIEN